MDNQHREHRKHSLITYLLLANGITWLLTFLAEPQAATLLVALMPWAVVLILQKRLGKERFPGKPQS